MLHLSVPLWLVLAGDLPVFAVGCWLSFKWGSRAVAAVQAVKADVAPVVQAAQSVAQDVKKA